MHPIDAQVTTNPYRRNGLVITIADRDSGYETRILVNPRDLPSRSDGPVDGAPPSVTVQQTPRPSFAPSSPTAVEVGVAYKTFPTNYAAATYGDGALCAEDGIPKRVFTYDALASLDLTIGDRVVAPVGIINGAQTHERTATVVTLTPKPAPVRKRLITEKLT